MTKPRFVHPSRRRQSPHPNPFHQAAHSGVLEDGILDRGANILDDRSDLDAIYERAQRQGDDEEFSLSIGVDD